MSTTVHMLLHLAVLTATFLGIARLLPDVQIKGVGNAVLISVVFSVLNLLLGLALKALLFLPALLTFGLLFFFIPFIVNTVILWLTDKLLDRFEIKSVRALLLSASSITLVNWLFQFVVAHGHKLQR
jgi:putative membrane protein